MYIFNLKMYISRLSLYISRLKIENCIRKYRFLYARRGVYYYDIKKETAQCEGTEKVITIQSSLRII